MSQAIDVSGNYRKLKLKYEELKARNKALEKKNAELIVILKNINSLSQISIGRVAKRKFVTCQKPDTSETSSYMSTDQYSDSFASSSAESFEHAYKTCEKNTRSETKKGKPEEIKQAAPTTKTNKVKTAETKHETQVTKHTHIPPKEVIPGPTTVPKDEDVSDSKSHSKQLNCTIGTSSDSSLSDSYSDYSMDTTSELDEASTDKSDPPQKTTTKSQGPTSPVKGSDTRKPDPTPPKSVTPVPAAQTPGNRKPRGEEAKNTPPADSGHGPSSPQTKKTTQHVDTSAKPKNPEGSGNTSKVDTPKAGGVAGSVTPGKGTKQTEEEGKYNPGKPFFSEGDLDKTLSSKSDKLLVIIQHESSWENADCEKVIKSTITKHITMIIQPTFKDFSSLRKKVESKAENGTDVRVLFLGLYGLDETGAKEASKDFFSYCKASKANIKFMFGNTGKLALSPPAKPEGLMTDSRNAVYKFATFGEK